MCSSGACARRAPAMGVSRRACCVSVDPFMVPGESRWRKGRRSAQVQVLPSRRLVTNEMSLGVFHSFYVQLPVECRNWMDNPKADFLWVFGADKTPSPALAILLESDFKALFCSHCEADILKGASHLLAFCCLCRTDKKKKKGLYLMKPKGKLGILFPYFELLEWGGGGAQADVYSCQRSNLSNCSL